MIEARAFRAIFGAANYWGSPITTGSHHYARRFVESGWEVAYLSDQISPLHLLRRKSRMYTADKFRLWAGGGRRELDGRLFAYNHLTLLPVFGAPLLRSRFVADHTMQASVPSLRGKLESEGFERADLLWIEHVLFADLFARLSADVRVYRMADDPRLFPEAYPRPMLERAERLLRDADLIVVTSHRLFDTVTARRRDGVVYVPNGVDYTHFAASGAPIPPEYLRIPEPRVVYAGSLEAWFDEELLFDVARARPRVSFVLIGPARLPLRRLRSLSNVHVLGARPYAAIPRYLGHAQAGIIPFRASEHVDAVNPIKLYEYLAAGLPVVVTDWDELRRLSAPARLANGSRAFGEALDDALASRGDAEARRAFARQNSWQARFSTVLDALGMTAPV